MEKQQELLSTQLNAENTQNKENSSKILDRRPIKGTPFTSIHTEDKMFIVMGKTRLSKDLEPTEKPEKWLKDNMWDVIGALILDVIEYQLKQIKQEEQLKPSHKQSSL